MAKLLIQGWLGATTLEVKHQPPRFDVQFTISALNHGNCMRRDSSLSERPTSGWSLQSQNGDTSTWSMRQVERACSARIQFDSHPAAAPFMLPGLNTDACDIQVVHAYKSMLCCCAPLGLQTEMITVAGSVPLCACCRLMSGTGRRSSWRQQTIIRTWSSKCKPQKIEASSVQKAGSCSLAAQQPGES